MWGTGLIRSLLKPGKPPHLATSLRGIRLLSRYAAWFSQVLDQRLRRVWQAGPEQFGFKPNIGCMEAVSVLVALISSRTSCNNRLYVAFIDLRTAFPSINRTILIQRMILCGVSYHLCRLVIAIFDMS
eukprot:2006772-Karenia_brevis.AAC.1